MGTVHVSSRALLDSLFSQYISDSSLTSDFERLQQFLASSSIGPKKFVDSFMSRSSNHRKNPRKSIPKSPSKNATLRPSIRRSVEVGLDLTESTEISIPRFYPTPTGSVMQILRDLNSPDSMISLQGLADILSNHLSLPTFFALPIMIQADPSIIKTRRFELQYSRFLAYSHSVMNTSTVSERVFNVILGRNTRDYLIPSDFPPFITPLIRSHQSLSFLKSEQVLQTAFTKCVIARIFYALDTTLRGRITLRELMSSNLCDCLMAVDKAADVSDVADYFSYEHFYVIFSRFWDIDTEETGQPTIDQLASYDNFRLDANIVKKMVSLFPGERPEGCITFTDFVYFINAVEDKSTETALRIWFNVCDTDSDGLLSMAEIEKLYSVQKEKMAKNGMDPIKFKLVITQLIDMIGTKADNISLSAIKKLKNWETVFNMIVDFKKFSEWEHRDPMFEMKMSQVLESTRPWDVFCQIEYVRLSSEPEDSSMF